MVSSHSLEHVIDPLGTLEKFYSLLKDGGVLFVEVPNASEEFFENYRTDAPHISFFTVDSLMLLAQKAGFTILHIQEYRLSLKMYSPDIKLSPDFIEQPRKNGWSIRALFEKGTSLPSAQSYGL